MKTSKIIRHAELEAVKRSFFQDIESLNNESARINKIIKDRLSMIKKIDSEKSYTQTIESNIR